jgi:hypothetical protein
MRGFDFPADLRCSLRPSDGSCAHLRTKDAAIAAIWRAYACRAAASTVRKAPLVETFVGNALMASSNAF